MGNRTFSRNRCYKYKLLIIISVLLVSCSVYKSSTSFAEIQNEELKQCIKKYVSENQDTNPTMMLLNVSEKGDTTCYRMVLVRNIGDFFEPSIHFFAKIDDLPDCYIGVRYLSYPGMAMTLEGIVQVLKKDFPYVREAYRIYQKYQNNLEMPPNQALFMFLTHYNECELKFVRGALISNELFTCSGDLISKQSFVNEASDVK